MHKTCVGPTRETTEANDITVYYKKLKKKMKRREEKIRDWDSNRRVIMRQKSVGTEIHPM